MVKPPTKKVGDGGLQQRTGAKIPQELLAAAAAHVAKTAKPKPTAIKPPLPQQQQQQRQTPPAQKKRDLESKKGTEEEEEPKKKKEEEPKKKIMKKQDVQEHHTDEMCFPVFNIQPRRMFVIYMCECCSVQESICAPSGKQVITITVCPTCVMKNDKISACT